MHALYRYWEYACILSLFVISMYALYTFTTTSGLNHALILSTIKHSQSIGLKD